MAKETSWLQAIVRVLGQAGRAMHYSEIADQIIEQKLRIKVGATPAATVNSYIAPDIKQKGSESIFIRVGRGEYMLNPSKAAIVKKSDSPTAGANHVRIDQHESDEGEQTRSIKAFGMYWRRDMVNWSSKPRLMGAQAKSATAVDFSDQRGVYLLHDGKVGVYVGRTTDRALGQRLYEHNFDRLNGRWDRFSWFGLRKVTQNGNLSDIENASPSAEQIIADFEAILIESLEPPLNRKRGDDLSAIEFIQTQDPELKKKEQEKFIREILDSLRSKGELVA